MKTLIPIFHGRVTNDGRLELRDDEQQRRRVWLHTLKGRDVEMTLRKVRTKRSLDQNAYLHAVPFPILAEEFGDDIEGTKLLLMGECWGWKRCPITGREIPVKPHTSDMTVEECAYFIDWLIPWAAKRGIWIPLPNEVAA